MNEQMSWQEIETYDENLRREREFMASLDSKKSIKVALPRDEWSTIRYLQEFTAENEQYKFLLFWINHRTHGDQVRAVKLGEAEYNNLEEFAQTLCFDTSIIPRSFSCPFSFTLIEKGQASSVRNVARNPGRHMRSVKFDERGFF